MVSARDKCKDMMGYISAVSGGVLPYNSMMFQSEWDAVESPIKELFGNSTQREDIFKALHIDHSTKRPVFNWASDSVQDGYKYDNMVDYSFYYNYLIQAGYPFIV